MDKQTILASVTPEVVEKFRQAIELGKWPDGRKLTPEQRETCMQAVMVWEHEHLPPAERTGYIHKPVRDDGSVVGAECDVEHEHHYPNMPNPKGAVQPVKFHNK
ncbi:MULTISPECIES: YeaC family protein [Psychrobacter]|jgi:hypothetical protein|uniref:YeaC family protein n=2 Tax=Psychrobacter TaxID=497 RepID=A0ABR8RFA0_9GAMM|nr:MULTISPECIES: DUF1315 family protein [Psychrobacter]MBD7946472.1 YeaC family protein [Psychrobacter communis]MBO6199144.1 YeaC family protein [Psychrobacter sp.]MBP7956262.1 YeaC family protein [Psychrobacter sp.]MBP8046817.1 YeaC family protein [Psychrobacter sp.]MBP9647073.1 YeaC family protein [Psychrobacter sp.]